MNMLKIACALSFGASLLFWILAANYAFKAIEVVNPDVANFASCAFAAFAGSLFFGEMAKAILRSTDTGDKP